ncbi:MAG: hypothetical protein RIC36_07195 [Rhodospirillales bacterium]
MTIAVLGELISGSVSRMRETARQTAKCAALVLLSVAILTIAAGFGLAAVYLHLVTFLPAHEAAGYIAAGLFVTGSLILFITLHRGQSRTVEPAAQTPPPAVALQSAMDNCTQAASDVVRRNPGSTLMTALAAGAIIGLLKPKD